MPCQGLLENEGHAYHNWGLSQETRPAVYVEPISYADVQRVVGDPLRFPTPADLTIPRQLARDRFTTKYYAQFLG